MICAAVRSRSLDSIDAAGRGPIEITGDLGDLAGDWVVLAERLRRPVERALAEMSSRSVVEIDAAGHVGEIVVRIQGGRACLRLAFPRDEAEPGFVAGVVCDAVRRFGL